MGSKQSSVDGAARTFRDCNLTIVNKQTAVAIGAAAKDTCLLGIQIHTALTGTCVIAGFEDDAGAAASYTIPAASVGFKDFLGAINSKAALTITCSNAADALKVAVLWRPNTNG
jgi:hypothetical protein